MHEIVTLQLGQKANHVGTHFWNTQESYFTYAADEESLVDHDVHFRSGLGGDGSETFLPRALIYDLKGGFGSLRKINALYDATEPAEPHGLWNGPPVIQQQPAIPQNAYQQSLEEGLAPIPLTVNSVKYWSDFSRVYYHPKSVVQINEYELNSTIMPFESFAAGEELFNSLDLELGILDTDLRPFAEEADQLQGFQIMSSNDDAWAGFAARYVDQLRDEFGKAAVCFWGIGEETMMVPRERRLPKILNISRSFAEIAPQASLYIPLNLPRSLPTYVNLDTKSPWHVSALLSTAYESIMLPTRLSFRLGGRESMDSITTSVNLNGKQNIARLQMSINSSTDPLQGEPASSDGHENGRVSGPAPNGDTLACDMKGTQFDMDFFNKTSERPLRSGREYHMFGRFECRRAPTWEHEESSSSAWERAQKSAAGLPFVYRVHTPMPFPVLDSFPHMYANEHLSSVNVSSCLETNATIALELNELRGMAQRAAPVEEREILGNSLSDIAEQYVEGWESGSDEVDD